MARYRDPRIDYSIADAARELKDLVLELSLQRDKFKLQEKLRREDREYTAAISMYQDAKKEAIASPCRITSTCIVSAIFVFPTFSHRFF